MINKPNKKTGQEWRETSLKGRMAESLVFELLKECGDEVYKIGYEHILPAGAAKIKKLFESNTEISKKIRAIPDFFVIDKNGYPHLIEVKYRWNLKIHPNDFERIKTIQKFWEETIIIFVNPELPYFKACYAQNPFTENQLAFNFKKLESIKYLNIAPDILNKFNDLAKRYFSHTIIKQP